MNAISHSQIASFPIFPFWWFPKINKQCSVIIGEDYDRSWPGRGVSQLGKHDSHRRLGRGNNGSFRPHHLGVVRLPDVVQTPGPPEIFIAATTAERNTFPNSSLVSHKHIILCFLSGYRSIVCSEKWSVRFARFHFATQSE